MVNRMKLKTIIIGITLLLLGNGIVHVLWLEIESVTIDMIPAHNLFSLVFLLTAGALFVGTRLSNKSD